MSGRPKNPKPWAVGNYPAGANTWNGTPLRVQGAQAYLEPGTRFSAQKVNDQLGDTADGLRSVLDYVGSLPAQNWHTTAVGLSGTDALSGLCYDASQGLWAAIAHETAGGGQFNKFRFYWSYDGEVWLRSSAMDFDAFIGGGSVSATCFDMVACGNGKFVALFSSYSLGNASRFRLVQFDMAALTSSELTLAGSSTPNTGNAPVSGRIVQHTSSVFVALMGGSTANVAVSSDTGVSWTTHAANIPASLQGTRDWDMCSDGTYLYAIPRASGATKWMRSPDGVTWTEETFPAGVQDGTRTPGSIASGTDKDGVVMVMLAMQTTTPGTRFHTSSDAGTTFPLKAQLGNSIMVQSLKGFGALWCAITEVSRAGRVIFSVDNGVSWRPGAKALTDDAVWGAETAMYSQMKASPQGFGLVNSKFLCLSHEAGLPAVMS